MCWCARVCMCGGMWGGWGVGGGACMCLYLKVNSYTRLCRYVCMHVCACMCVCMCVCVCVCLKVNSYTLLFVLVSDSQVCEVYVGV